MKACNQCGKCCMKYGNGGLSASATDIELWEIFRPEIYKYVRDGNIWMNPETGVQLEACPWLRKLPGELKYTCAIYHDRPEDCRIYPNNIEEMVRDECEMIEIRDLKNIKGAQLALEQFKDSE